MGRCRCVNAGGRKGTLSPSVFVGISEDERPVGKVDTEHDARPVVGIELPGGRPFGLRLPDSTRTGDGCCASGKDLHRTRVPASQRMHTKRSLYVSHRQVNTGLTGTAVYGSHDTGPEFPRLGLGFCLGHGRIRTGAVFGGKGCGERYC